MTPAAALTLPEGLVALLRGTATCYLATTMPDGSPQLTRTWVDTDGIDVLVNTVVGHQKTRNVQRDPRVALAVSPADGGSPCVELRGRVTGMTTDGAAEHVEALAQRYLGGPYPWYGGRAQQRLLLRIRPEKLNVMG